MTVMHFNEYIDSQKDRFLSDLARLVKVRSVREDATAGHPYGDGPAKALDEAIAICAEHGFDMKNLNYHAGETDLGEDPALLILAHLDVVDEGEGWTKPPYEMTEEDGKLYGRGTMDDKGPALAALYAMEAVRECGIKLNKGVRLVLGCAEETGSEDMEYYFKNRPALPYCFSPDAAYPLIHLEKGRFAPYFSKSWDAVNIIPRIMRIDGGTTPNIVPCKASAVVLGLTAAQVQPVCDAYKEKTGANFVLTEEFNCEGGVCCKKLVITAEGAAAHASEPYKGNNAQTALLALLGALPLADTPCTQAVAALNRLFPHGDTAGETVGIAMKDDISGDLTFNFGVLSMDETGCTACFDSRVPVCANKENVFDVVAAALQKEGFALYEDAHMIPAHHVPKDAPIVQTLLSVYEQYTGEKGEAYAIGGGTYVHDIEGGVAFGCEMPGVDYRLHGADEFADLDTLLLSAKMFAEAIVRLCGE